MNQDWVEVQSKSMHHKLAIYLFPLVIFLGYQNSILFIIGIVLFFLVTSFKLLKSMLFWMLVLGGISLIFPIIAPVIFVIMIILFFMRIGYVIKNWRPFVSGIFLYGIVALLIYRSYYLNYYYYDVNRPVIEGAIVAVFSFICLRLLLRWLYRNNYASYAALGIMGSVPVIIIAFILPFLKLHIGGDFFAAETAVETKPTSGDAYVETKIGTGEPIGTRATVSSEQPLVHVKDHVRTAPDGDPTNNLSYEGPDKKAPNRELVEVREHVRTPPDSDLTNNLSYNNSEDSNDHQAYTEAASSNEVVEKESTKEKIIEVSKNTVSGQVAVDQLLRELKKQEEDEALR